VLLVKLNVCEPEAPPATVTAKVLGELLPQELSAVTVILPELPPNVTVIEVLPCPAVILLRKGTVQVYVLALATGLIE